MITPTALSEKLLFITLRLEVQKAAGIAKGTRFLFAIRTGRGQHIPLLAVPNLRPRSWARSFSKRMHRPQRVPRPQWLDPPKIRTTDRDPA
jgi:hypothetical protein